MTLPAPPCLRDLAPQLPASPDDRSLYVSVEAEPLDSSCTIASWKPAFDALMSLVLEGAPGDSVATKTLVDTSVRGARAVQLTRLAGEPTLVAAFQPLAASSHERRAAVEHAVAAFTAVGRLTRLVVLGPLGEPAIVLLLTVSTRWGWPPPTVLRSPLPAWFTRLLLSGEAVACLSLTSNLAASKTPPQAGQKVPYVVRGRHGAGVVKLSDTFEYVVDAVFGDELNARGDDEIRTRTTYRTGAAG